MSNTNRKNRVFSIFLVVLLFLFYSGCSSSDRSKDEHNSSIENNSSLENNSSNNNFDENISNYTFSGIIQKGNFIDGTLTIKPIGEDNSSDEKIVTTSIDKLGNYLLKVPWNGTELLLLSAKGKFFDEYRGENSSDEVELYTLLKLEEDKKSYKINLNLFTSFEYKRIIKLMKDGLSYDKAKEESRKNLFNEFGVSKEINLSQLNLLDTNGTLKKENLNLLLFSGTLLKVIQNNPLQKTLNSSTKSFFKIGKRGDFISKLNRDFENNGKIDDIAKSGFQQMQRDNASQTIAKIAKNLSLTFNSKLISGIGWKHQDTIELPDDTYVFVTPPPVNISRLTIYDFSLKTVTVNSIVKNYNNNQMLFIGGESESVSLEVSLKSRFKKPVTYKVNIYAQTEGKGDILLINDETIRTTATKRVGYRRYYVQSKIVSIPINSSFRSYIKEAYSANKEVKLKVVAHVVEEDGVNSVKTKISSSLPRLMSLSSDMYPTTTIQQSHYLGECSGTSSNLHLLMNIEGLYKGAPIAYENVCVELVYNETTKEYDAKLIRGEGKLSTPYSIELGGLPLDVYTLGIDKIKERIAKVVLKLPKGHSIHYAENGYPLAKGSNSMVLDQPHIRRLNHGERLPEEFTGLLDKEYLHIKNFPFYLGLKEFTLNRHGLTLPESKIKYLFDYTNRYKNNSERFRNPSSDSIDFLLTKDGVSSTQSLEFGAMPQVYSSYPQLLTQTDAFSFKLSNSQLIDISSKVDEGVVVNYMQGCKTVECGENQKVGVLHLNNIDGTNIYADGSTILYQEERIGKVEWGARERDYVFNRMEDVGAKIYLPGFELPTQKADEVASYLLGTVEERENHTLLHHSSTEMAVKEGKHLFAGVNVGNLQGESDGALEDKIMTLVLGNKKLLLTSDAYSKYFIRPSGVTGLFNDKPNDSLVNVYGYNFQFKHFKFRQQYNILDVYTKVNGIIDLKGKAKLKIAFNNLALDCRGNLNDGVVEACDIEHQTNCTQIIDSWKLKTTFTTIGFENREDDICGQKKELSLGHILKVTALKDRIAATIRWNKDGVPLKTEVFKSSQNQLDGDSSKDDERTNGGYDIEVGKLLLTSAEQEHWIESDISIGLPFWGINKMSVRMANRDASHREPTVMTARGELYNNGRDRKSNNQTLVDMIKSKNGYKNYLSHRWAGLIGFSLPVYYDSSESTIPKFLGRTASSDLIVLKSHAGIDYITPDKTSMSFGASADFEQLKGLKLHIDLNDPKSLKEIDATLKPYIGDDLYLGSRGPLELTIGQLVENVNIGNSLLKNGLTMGMEEGAVLALEEAGNQLPIDPFEEIAKSNAKLHNFPVVINDKFKDLLESKIEALLDRVVADEHSNIDAVQDEINRYLNDYENLKDYLLQTQSILQDIPRSTELVSQAEGFVFKYGFGGSKEECSWSNFTQKGFFKPLGEVNSAINTVNDKLHTVDMKTISKFAKKAGDFSGLDSKDLVSVVEKVRTMSEDLDVLVNKQNGWIRKNFDNDGYICGGMTNIKTSLDESLKLLAPIDNTLNNIENNITEVIALLDNSNNTIEKLRDLANQDVDQLLVEFKDVIVSPIIEKTDGMTVEVQKEIPILRENELRRLVVTKLFETEPVRKLVEGMNSHLTPVADELNKLSLILFSSLDKNINKLLSKVNVKINEILSKATSTLDKIPLATASMDGYAMFYGDSLAQLHVGSEFKVSGKDKDSSFSMNAALDIKNDEIAGTSGCKGKGSKSNLHGTISTRDISMALGSEKLQVDLILLGVTLGINDRDEAELKGIFGAISSSSGFDFDKFKLYNLGLATGIGETQTYLGAKANATLDNVQLGVSFLVGQVCNPEVIEMLIPPSIYDFMTIPNNKFNGGLVYGEAQVPVWDNGCMLTVNARAKLGTWFIFGPPKTFGGIIGGGAFGKGLCIATLGGEIELLAEKSGNNVQFQGSGWGAAGVGSCDNSWSSISDSRSDSWCGTGDASFGANFNNGWTLLDISTSAVH